VDWSNYDEVDRFYSEYEKIVERKIVSWKQESTNYISSLSGKIRVYLQSTLRTKVIPDQETGRIYKRNLVRLGMPIIDGGKWNKKVFSLLEKKRGLDTAVMLLVDSSSSMCGTKFKHAKKASLNLAHVLQSIHIPYGVAFFSSSGGLKHHIAVAKNINENIPLDSFAGILMGYRPNGCNNDSDSILWAINKLKGRKEKRKIIIVLSDGMPSVGIWAHSSLHKICDEIEKSRDYEIYGIGIQDNDVARYYRHNKIIDRASQVEEALLGILKEIL
jgi:cobalamin biosynthesis protein CobT